MPRASAARRGYGRAHRREKARVAATLPRLCGFGCGTMLWPNGRWHLAHVVDGDDSKGYVPACPRCNELAKARYRAAPPG